MQQGRDEGKQYYGCLLVIITIDIGTLSPRGKVIMHRSAAVSLYTCFVSSLCPSPLLYPHRSSVPKRAVPQQPTPARARATRNFLFHYTRCYYTNNSVTRPRSSKLRLCDSVRTSYFNIIIFKHSWYSSIPFLTFAPLSAIMSAYTRERDASKSI